MRFNPGLRKRHVGLLAAVYLLALAATAPASLLERALFAVPGVTLEQLQGTLWRGATGKLNIASPLGAIQISDLQWAVQWRYLLRGELVLKLETAAAVGSLSVARGFGGLRILQADLAMPAADLAHILPPLAAWQPGGEVQFQTTGFALNSSKPGTAFLAWQNATLNLSPLQPLGDYRLEFSSTADKIAARLETQRGSLQLEGHGEYTKQAGAHFSGSAQAEAQHAQALQTLLALLGPDRSNGVHAFEFHLP